MIMRPIYSVLLVMMFFVACNTTGKKQEQTHPNVLFILVDDLNDWEGVLLGNSQAITPNMDNLFSEGVLFTNAHASQPVCTASRNSILSGIHPSSSGCMALQKICEKITIL